jgi:DNA ligase D-like protein (predicted polymerase)/DNA ligase D-like protein (predicted 3'-phosphoesterase)
MTIQAGSRGPLQLMDSAMSLAKYHQKRKFDRTPEPRGQPKHPRGPLRFVVQKHHASRLHYDFRLELDGTLKSWAVPKGPSMKPGDKRLAVMVEDHPLDYRDFEGIIPAGNYGAGSVIVWDEGNYCSRATSDRQESERILREGLREGHLTFVLNGHRLKGEFALHKLKRGDDKNWLLLKKRDDWASDKDITSDDRSVVSGKTLGEIAENPPRQWRGRPSSRKLAADHTQKPAAVSTTPKARIRTSHDKPGKVSREEAEGEPPFTNLQKIYWPDEGYTKGDLIDYYRAVAPVILPYLSDRPESLHRHPNGIAGASFFQKDVGKQPPPPWVRTVPLYSDSNDADITYLLCQNAKTLLYLANLGCIELNPWNSRVGALDRPDYLVIDLDPEDVPFARVVEAALAVRKTLDRAGGTSICKTSGKRGMHVYVPLGARYDYDHAKQFAEIIATLVHHQLPATTSVLRSPAKRQGRVYLDFLQNRRGQTLAAPYSVRPWPGATVSTPLAWKEVTKRLDPTKFTMFTMPKRIDKVGDLWESISGPPIDLVQCLTRLAKA